ncbi:acyl-CoA dehydrogenase, partial [bacterium]|nr:acyl-CoA dehydrogenase [bacterium]
MENIPFWGQFLGSEYQLYASLGTAALVVFLGYFGAPFWLWSLALIVALIGFGAPLVVVAIALAVCAIFVIPPLRQALASSVVFKTMKALGLIPKISQTERTALEAGVVWMESELFSGKPDFKKMLDQPYSKLTAEEQSFLDNEVEELCRMINDYEMFKTKVMPPEVFEFIKKKGF